MSTIDTALTGHDFTFDALDGGPLPLSDFRGRALLVVNTASRCGFRGQIDGLQRLWTDWRDRGLTVVGVPSADFMGQEPLDSAGLADWCACEQVDFPMAAKTHVRGAKAHPFYGWVGDMLGRKALPKWNFHKIVVGADGRAVDWFSPMTGPSSDTLKRALREALP